MSDATLISFDDFNCMYIMYELNVNVRYDLNFSSDPSVNQGDS